MVSINYLMFPVDYQLGFQKPATVMMEGIIDLHHDIMSFLVFIICFVGVFFVSILVEGFLQGTMYDIQYNKGRLLVARSNFKKQRFTQYLIKEGVTHQTELETVWTIVPTLILLFIATPSFALIYALDEIVEPELTVRVIGRQWYWTYEISDYLQLMVNNLKVSLPGFAFNSYLFPIEDLAPGTFRLLEVTRKLVLPVQTNIRLLITSYDVLHSWAVPSFGVKVDAVPGRLNEYFLNVHYFGTFYGQCSEICGVNHGFMPIKVESVSVSSFFSWFVNNSLLEGTLKQYLNSSVILN